MVFGKRLRNMTTRVQDRVAEATAVAEEAFTQIRTVQSFVQEPAERARYGERVAGCHVIAGPAAGGDMQVLSPRVDWQGFLEGIARAPERVLMLDYDGTLAPFQVRPERAAPYAGVRETLEALTEAGGTRVVIVSGRPAAHLVPLLDLQHSPEIWGVHGWERLLPDGKLYTEEPSPAVKVSLEKAAAATQDVIRKGGRLERKRASIAPSSSRLRPTATSGCSTSSSRKGR